MKSAVEDIKSLHWDRERGGQKSSVNAFYSSHIVYCGWWVDEELHLDARLLSIFIPLRRSRYKTPHQPQSRFYPLALSAFSAVFLFLSSSFRSPFFFVVCLPWHVCFSSLSPPLFDYESSSQLFDIFNRLGFDNKKILRLLKSGTRASTVLLPLTTNGFISFYLFSLFFLEGGQQTPGETSNKIDGQ